MGKTIEKAVQAVASLTFEPARGSSSAGSRMSERRNKENMLDPASKQQLRSAFATCGPGGRCGGEGFGES